MGSLDRASAGVAFRCGLEQFIGPAGNDKSIDRLDAQYNI